jgi:hypothetical protein
VNKQTNKTSNQPTHPVVDASRLIPFLFVFIFKKPNKVYEPPEQPRCDESA